MKNHRTIFNKDEKGELQVEVALDGDELLNYMLEHVAEITVCEQSNNPAAVLIVEKAKHYRECHQPDCLISLAKAIYIFRCSRVN